MAQSHEYELGMIISDEDSDAEYDIVMAASDEDTEAETDIDEAVTDVKEDYEEADTSAVDVRRGGDIQGIHWQRTNITRQKYRENKIKEYESHMDVPQSQLAMDQLDNICKKPQKGGNFYEFQRNARSVKPTYSHFQLRELVWATSKHDVYISSENSIIHWSALSRKLVNVMGPVVASRIHLGAALHGSRVVQITSMAVNDNLLVVGGYGGELMSRYLGINVDHFWKITENQDDDVSTNSIEIYQSPGGATRVMTASNDCGVRVFDPTDGFALIQQFSLPWAVNRVSVSPDNKLFVVVGDNVEGFLSDSQTGKVVATLQGHLDYSFASAWHPDGTVFATGNQDTTCRLWDVRNTSISLEVFKGNMAAIRSIKFSSDGQFMAMSEHADFVHIFDTKHMYNKSQEIDFFGEITGISFSPDTESLFIGVHGVMLGGLLEYKTRHQSFYLDSLM